MSARRRPACDTRKITVTVHGAAQIATWEAMCAEAGRRPHELAGDLLLDAIRRAQHDHGTRALAEAVARGEPLLYGGPGSRMGRLEMLGTLGEDPPGPRALPQAYAVPAGVFDVTTCRVCGCSEDDGCPGGCWWVPDPEMGDLCSACAPAAGVHVYTVPGGECGACGVPFLDAAGPCPGPPAGDAERLPWLCEAVPGPWPGPESPAPAGGS